jgi:hypothetical protein
MVDNLPTINEVFTDEVKKQIWEETQDRYYYNDTDDDGFRVGQRLIDDQITQDEYDRINSVLNQCDC